jgi:hypothetical protein
MQVEVLLMRPSACLRDGRTGGVDPQSLEDLAGHRAAGDERGHLAPSAAGGALRNVILEHLWSKEAQSRRRARSGMAGGPSARGSMPRSSRSAARTASSSKPVSQCSCTASQPRRRRSAGSRITLALTLALGAKTPKYLTVCRFGVGTSAESRLSSCVGVKATAVVPSKSGRRRESTTRPSAARDRRSRPRPSLAGVLGLRAGVRRRRRHRPELPRLNAPVTFSRSAAPGGPRTRVSSMRSRPRRTAPGEACDGVAGAPMKTALWTLALRAPQHG